MKLKWIIITGSSLFLSLIPIYYAKNTGDFSDYCLSGVDIAYTTCHLDIEYTLILTTSWFLMVFPIVTALYFLFEKVIKENFP